MTANIGKFKVIYNITTIHNQCFKTISKSKKLKIVSETETKIVLFHFDFKSKIYYIYIESIIDVQIVHNFIRTNKYVIKLNVFDDNTFSKIMAETIYCFFNDLRSKYMYSLKFFLCTSVNQRV